jgi:Rrf2 family transcriptional regulator, cysteine metabolism repressor
MKISQKSEYALAAMLDLSLLGPGELAKAAEIAARQQIPIRFLELILAELRQRGFVSSRRGANGGHCLAKAAEKIRVGEILTCLGERRPRKTKDGLTDLWNRVDRSAWGILNNTTFAEIAAESKNRAAAGEIRALDLAQSIVSLAARPAGLKEPDAASVSLSPRPDGKTLLDNPHRVI